MKNKIIKRINRIESIIKKYKQNEKNLSTYGQWSLGYWQGRLSGFEDCLNYLEERKNEKVR